GVRRRRPGRPGRGPQARGRARAGRRAVAGRRPGGGAVNFLKGLGMTILDRKSTRLNSSHRTISYAVFCLKKKKDNSHHAVLCAAGALLRSVSVVRLMRARPRSPLFPYTTLFRSVVFVVAVLAALAEARKPAGGPAPGAGPLPAAGRGEGP